MNVMFTRAITIMIAFLIIGTFEVLYSDDKSQNAYSRERSMSFEPNVVEYPETHDSLILKAKNQNSGASLALSDGWKGYKVIMEGQNVENPNHPMLKILDSNYSTIRIRHPKWTEQSPYQDIVLTVFRISEWNKNAGIATDRDVRKLPHILQSAKDYILTVDHFNYDSKLIGYDEVLNVLLRADNKASNRTGTMIFNLISIDTNNLVYDSRSNLIKIAWHNGSKDEMLWNGLFSLEKYEPNGWVSIYIQPKTKDKLYAIPCGQSKWLDCPMESDKVRLEPGLYRIGAEYLRKSVYRIEFSAGKYPMYKVFEEFKVDDANLPRNADYSSVEKVLKGIGMRTELSNYKPGISKIKVKWYNNSKEDLTYGLAFTLEKRNGKGWEPVKIKSDQGPSFPLIGYSLLAHQSSWTSYDLDIYSKGLTAGFYRICTHFLLDTYKRRDFKPVNYPSYKLYANFTVR